MDGSLVGLLYSRNMNFEICLEARCDNACSQFLSRPVELLGIGESQPCEANLEAILNTCIICWWSMIKFRLCWTRIGRLKNSYFVVKYCSTVLSTSFDMSVKLKF